MQNSRSSCRTASCLFFLLILLGLFALVWAALSLPTRATITFGPPAEQLDPIQLVRLSAKLLWQADELTTPRDPGGESRRFIIERGETPRSIAARLQNEGLIPNADIFVTYLVYSGLDTTLQAREYTLSPALTAVQIARSLQDATPQEITFTILAGWRLEEIAASLPTSGLNFTPDHFVAACRLRPKGFTLLEELPADATLEGFLAPDSYRLSRDTTAAELIAILLESTTDRLTPEIQQGFSRQGLSIYRAVTLASIVQREAVVADEMPLIASVFLNRLAIGMRLEADSTVQYAIGYNRAQQTWWTNPLSADDLQINSPYNTYRNPDLPPGPIANPGLNALQAAAFPAATPYYYFRAACDGSGRHLFARTFEEHLQNACP